MRVLHVAQPREGGVAGYVLAACLDQLARGWQVTVACPDGGRLADDLKRAGVPRLRWPAVRSPGPVSVAEAVRLGHLVEAGSPDLVHLHASKAGLAGRLRLRHRVPVVFQPHGWSWLAVDGPLRTATLAWERAAARWTDLFLCVGDAEAEQGKAHGVHGRYAVVRNGVDLSRFRAAGTEARGAARARLGLDAATPLAVCVGRLTRQKGQDVLLAAWPAVRRHCPQAKLALVGDGDQRAALEGLAKPGVIFAGAVDDVRDWLAAADVVVLPSRWEGLSLAVLEALAVGRSVVVSDVPGLAEVVSPAVGAKVAAEDPAALADALIARLANPALTRAEGVTAAVRAERYDLRLTYDRLAAETTAVLERR